jgi:glycosyltransferase involved in cell wall biosynthesis
MIAYAFPPEGNAGAYRPVRFVRHLSRLGWRVSVVTCNPPSYERYDSNLLSLIPPEVEVKRVSCNDPWQSLQAKRMKHVRETQEKGDSETVDEMERSQQSSFRSFFRRVVRKAEACSYHPDMAMPWIEPATKAAVSACHEGRSNVIWATAGPVSSFVVAERASRKLGIPYVLDFRDAWTISQNDFEALKPGWMRRMDRRRMNRLLAGAQAVVFLYESVAQCFWTAYGGALASERIHIIPNGFEGPIEAPTPPSQTDRCEILYAGTLSSYHYEPFLMSIQQLREREPSLAAKLRVRFVGEQMDVIARRAGILNLSGIVEISAPLPHETIVKLQREAHALLIFGRPKTMKGHELFAGAKLFGYLKTGKPLLGVLHQDETRRILEQAGVKTIADSDSVPQIVGVLKHLAGAVSAGTSESLVPDRAVSANYLAETQTADLVKALEGKPATKPFVPGSVEVPPSLQEDLSRKWIRGRSASIHERFGRIFMRACGAALGSLRK